MDITTSAKNVATVLGTAAALGYACGYLALRARAFALGTGTNFTLVDEAYVFAGFRFLLMTLLFLLLMVPVLVGLRVLAAWGAKALPEVAQWVVIAVLAVLTIAAFQIMTVEGILLRPTEAARTGLEAAVLGEGIGLRFALVALLILLTAITGFWLYFRAAAPRSEVCVLAGLLVIQAMLQPIYHGALFADRRARILAAVPASATGLSPPLAIIDQTAEQATLLGAGQDLRLALVVVPQKDLYGIPVQDVTSLAAFLDRIRAAGTAPTRASAVTLFASQGGSAATDEAAPAGTWQSILDYLGVVLDAVGSLGDDDRASGQLWVAELDADSRPVATRQLGPSSDLSSPIVDPAGGFLALQRGRVVRLDPSGNRLAVLHDGAEWRRLIGVGSDGAVLGLIRDGGTTRLATLSATGIIRHPEGDPDEAERRAAAMLSSNARAYAGGRVLGVDRSQRSGRGFDIYLRLDSERIDITDCDPDACVQPSLAPDRRSIVFIRAPRF